MTNDELGPRRSSSRMTFAPYPGYPTNQDQLVAARARVASIPRGLGFFDWLDEDPEALAVFKTDIVLGALASNAEEPVGKRLQERYIVEHEQWCFDLFGI